MHPLLTYVPEHCFSPDREMYRKNNLFPILYSYNCQSVPKIIEVASLKATVI